MNQCSRLALFNDIYNVHYNDIFCGSHIVILLAISITGSKVSIWQCCIQIAQVMN